MAMVKVELEDRVVFVNEKALKRTQAVWRGSIVRRHMLRLRQLYQLIAAEIEKKPNLSLSWSGAYVGKPKFAIKPVVHINHPQVVTNVDNRRCNTGEIRLVDDMNTSHKDTQTTQDTDNIRKMEKREDHFQEKLTQTDTFVGNNICSTQAVQADTDVSKNLTETPTKLEHIPIMPNTDKSPHFHDNSSVWNSVEFSRSSSPHKEEKHEPVSLEDLNRKELLVAKNHIGMELLWIQQAINSRKQYLYIKSNLSAS